MCGFSCFLCCMNELQDKGKAPHNTQPETTGHRMAQLFGLTISVCGLVFVSRASFKLFRACQCGSFPSVQQLYVPTASVRRLRLSVHLICIRLHKSYLHTKTEQRCCCSCCVVCWVWLLGGCVVCLFGLLGTHTVTVVYRFPRLGLSGAKMDG